MNIEKELKAFAKSMIEKIPELRRCEISITKGGKYSVISFDCGEEDALNKLEYEYGMYMDANMIESFSTLGGYIHVIVRISEFNAYLFGLQIGRLVQ